MLQHTSIFHASLFAPTYIQRYGEAEFEVGCCFGHIANACKSSVGRFAELRCSGCNGWQYSGLHRSAQLPHNQGLYILTFMIFNISRTMPGCLWSDGLPQSPAISSNFESSVRRSLYHYRCKRAQ
jgi:hypothetical protein